MRKDIFREPLHPIEGIQEFDKRKAQNRISNFGKQKKDFCVVKEKKPSWRDNSSGWKQTYSVQRRDKMKELGISCLR